MGLREVKIIIFQNIYYQSGFETNQVDSTPYQFNFSCYFLRDYTVLDATLYGIIIVTTFSVFN